MINASPVSERNEDNERFWTITITDSGGFPHVTAARSREHALYLFMMYLHLICHTTKDAKFRIIGDDDAALTGLHLLEIPENLLPV